MAINNKYDEIKSCLRDLCISEDDVPFDILKNAIEQNGINGLNVFENDISPKKYKALRLQLQLILVDSVEATNNNSSSLIELIKYNLKNEKVPDDDSLHDRLASGILQSINSSILTLSKEIDESTLNELKRLFLEPKTDLKLDLDLYNFLCHEINTFNIINSNELISKFAHCVTQEYLGIFESFSNEISPNKFKSIKTNLFKSIINLGNDIETTEPAQNQLEKIKTYFTHIEESIDRSCLFDAINGVNIFSFHEVELLIGSNQKYVNQLLAYYMSCLKSGRNFGKLISTSKTFNDKSSKIFGTDEKMVTILALDFLDYLSQHIVYLLKCNGSPIPLVYHTKNLSTFEINLKALSFSIDEDKPFVVSMGKLKIGKSSLLNEIYSTKFNKKMSSLLPGGVDITLDADEFACGFNIVDVHGEMEAKALVIESLLKIFKLERCWILLQIDKTSNIIVYKNLLESLNIKPSQIILILRNVDDDCLENLKMKIDANFFIQVFGVVNLVQSDDKDISVTELKEMIFKITGIGRKDMEKSLFKKAKFPDINYTQKDRNYVYWEMDSICRNLNNSCELNLIVYSENMKILSKKLIDYLQANTNNLKSTLFPHSHYQLLAKFSKDSVEKEIIYKKKRESEISEIVQEYYGCLLKKEFLVMKEIEKIISFSQLDFITEKTNLRKMLKIKFDENTKNKIDNTELMLTIKNLDKEVDERRIGSELLLRELLECHADRDFLALNQTKYHPDLFVDSIAEYIIGGYELEIINGDQNTFDEVIFTKIFQAVENKLVKKAGHPIPISVISIIGPQSSGKSTLLNKLFHTNFQTSAGRCTKGVYVSLKRISKQNKDTYILILDTEGLLSIVKSDKEFDKKLTLFSMACSHIIVINVNGEIDTTMKDILSICLYAANRIQQLKHRPTLYFVLRNMNDIDKNKQSETIEGIKKALKEASEASEVNIEEALDYNGEDSFVLTVSAFDKHSENCRDQQLFLRTNTNEIFLSSLDEFRDALLSIVSVNSNDFSNLSSWVKHCAGVWTNIEHFSDFLSYESIKEIKEKDFLSSITTTILNSFIENTEVNKQKAKDLWQKYDFEEISLSEIVENCLKFDRLKDVLINIERIADTLPVKDSGITVEKLKANIKLKEIEFKEKCEIEFTKETPIEYQDKQTYLKRLKDVIDIYTTDSLKTLENTIEKQSIENIIEKKINAFYYEVQIELLDLQADNQSDSTEKKKKFKEKILGVYNGNQLIKKGKFSVYYDDFNESLKRFEKSRESVYEDVAELFKLRIGNEGIKSSNICYTTKTIDHLKKSISENNPFSKDKYSCLTSSETFIDNIFSLNLIDESQSSYETKTPSRTSSFKSTVKEVFTNWWRKFKEKFNYHDHQENTFKISIENKIKNGYKKFFDSTWQFLVPEIEHCADNLLNFKFLNEMLEEIFKLINDYNMMLKADENYLFKFNYVKTGEKIIEIVFDTMCNSILEKNIIELIAYRRNFYKKLDDVREYINNVLDNQFNDSDCSSGWISKLMNKIRQNCLLRQIETFLDNMKNQDLMTSNEFKLECDKVFASNNKVDIFKYVTQPIDSRQNEYVVKTFDKYFNKKLDKEKLYLSTILPQRLKEEIEKLKVLINNLLDYLKHYDSTFESNPNSNERNRKNKLYYKLIKFYLLNNVTEFVKIGKEINQEIEEDKRSSFIEQPFTNNKSLINSAAVFNNIFDINFIQSPNVFLTNCINKINQLSITTFSVLTEEESTIISLKNQRLRTIYDQIYKSTLGCTYCCPFCGVKCQEKSMSEYNHDKHYAEMHRLMAFGGCHEYVKTGNQSKIGFVFDICNSTTNMYNTYWGNSDFQACLSKNIVEKKGGFKERINRYHLSDTALRITLFWEDRNDLDLHVTCPCSTEIYFGMKTCKTCNMELEHDMNAHCCEIPCNSGNDRKSRQMRGCSKTPAEHVCFQETLLNDADKGNVVGSKGLKPKYGKYKIAVHFYRKHDQAPNPDVSQFDVEIAIAGRTYKQLKNLEVSVKNEVKEVYELEFNERLLNEMIEQSDKELLNSNSKRFVDHITHYEATKIWLLKPYQEQFNIAMENSMKRAWCLISKDMLQFYGDSVEIDNTPESFKSI